ncbi:MAG: cytochrome c [Polyangiaceae bacterium]|nr:cytochrome c [Polyangiaceae bacterium]
MKQHFLIKVFPNFFTDVRWTYLVYELLFVFLTAVLLYRQRRLTREASGSHLSIAEQVLKYVALYYSFWALADVIILAGFDAGYALRILPNLLYYGLYIPFLWLLLKRGSWAPPRSLSVLLLLGVGVGISGCQPQTPSCSQEELLALCPPAAKTTATAPRQVAAPALAVSGEFLAYREQTLVRRFSLPELIQGGHPESIETFDPYYERKKVFRALPLNRMLHRVLGLSPETKLKGVFEFVARDGYQVQLSAALVSDPDAFLAFIDEESGTWEPIGSRRADPAPLYMIWAGDNYRDVHKNPRPWAIAAMHWFPDGKDYPKLKPKKGIAPASKAARGHAIFLADCVRCHAINQQGGRVGPELNIPQNILEYRSEKFVRQFIENPAQFRISAMPPHPDFTDEDLDALVVYLQLMAKNKASEAAPADSQW